MNCQPSQPRLYSDLCSWFHLLTAPEDYAEEAEFIRNTLLKSARIPVEYVLELGSGGGNNALHLKKDFRMTLVDLSEGMLGVSRKINPECEHLPGDMRTIRLDRQFDAVLVHDAVMYMTTEAELMSAMKTAFMHCRPGAAALFLPDLIKETFVAGVHHGGHDGQGRGLRYLEWTFDANPADDSYTVDFAMILRERDGSVRVEHDRHVFGLFGRQTWLNLLSDAGFAGTAAVRDAWDREVFVATRGMK
jgi:SAM-dependent methyltransferase